MKMQEALEWAGDYAERNKLFEPVANQRGYADGWKPPSPADKAKVIMDLARQACLDSPGSYELSKGSVLTELDIENLRVVLGELDSVSSEYDIDEVKVTARSISNVLRTLYERASGTKWQS